MNDRIVQPKGSAFRALWARALLWKFSFMSAVLCTLLFALFPPQLRSATKKMQPALPEQVAYVPNRRAVANPSTPQTLAPVDRPPPVTATPQLSAPPTKHPLTAAASATTVGTRSATADLSLGAPVNTGRNPTPEARSFTGSIPVSGFDVPLPAGTWSVLANSSVSIPNSSGIGYFLGRIERNRLVGAVVIHALKTHLQPGSGYEAFKGCNSSTAIFVAKEGATPFDHQACWLMFNYFTPPWHHWEDKSVTMSALTRSAAGDMAAKGVAYPQDFVAVQLYRSEKWGMLDATYLFSPESEGIQSHAAETFRDADWFGPNIQRYPEKVAYASKLKDLGTTSWARFKTVFAAGNDASGETSAAKRNADSVPLSDQGTPFDPIDKWTATVVTARSVPAPGDVHDIADRFNFEGRIYAHVTLRSHPGATAGHSAFEVRWFNQGKLVNVQKGDKDVIKSPYHLASSTSGTTLGAGACKVEFYANGKMLGSKEFQVSAE